MTARSKPLLSPVENTHTHTGLWYAWEQQLLLTALIFIVNFILTYSLQSFLRLSPIALLSVSVCVSPSVSKWSMVMQQYYWLQPSAPQLWSRPLLIIWGAALAVFYFYSFWPDHLNLKTQRGDMEHNRLCHHPGFQRLSPASLRAMQVYTLMLTDKWVAAQRVYRKGDFGKSLGLVFVLTSTRWICQPHLMSLVLI